MDEGSEEDGVWLDESCASTVDARASVNIKDAILVLVFEGRRTWRWS